MADRSSKRAARKTEPLEQPPEPITSEKSPPRHSSAPVPVWKHAIKPLLLFLFVGVLLNIITGQSSRPVVVYCALDNQAGVRPDDLRAYAYVTVSPWNQTTVRPFGNSETTFNNGYVSSLSLQFHGEHPIGPLRFAIQVGPLVSQQFYVHPTDWTPHPQEPGTLVCNLGRILPKSWPLGGMGQLFLAQPVVNPCGFEEMFFHWPFLLLFPLAFVVGNELRRRDTNTAARKELAILFVGTLFFTVFVEYWLNLYWMRQFQPNIPELVAEAQKTFIYAGFLQPNPSLMIRYTLSIVVLPFLLLTGYGMFRLLTDRLRQCSDRTRNIVFLATILIGVAGPIASINSLTTDIYWVFLYSLYRISAVFTLLVVGWCLLYYPKQIRCFAIPVGIGLAILLLLGIFLLRLHRESFPPEAMHFDCVYYSVTQTMVGKTPLIDVNSLYGCFAVFLEPILRITGYGVFPFTLVMSALSIVSLVFLGGAVRLIVKDRLLAVFGTIYLFFYVYIFQYVWNGALSYPLMLEQQPYLMRFPIRTLTVFSSLFLMLHYYKNRSAASYYSLLALIFLAPFWNLDTGVILPIVWIVSVVVDEYLNRKSFAGFFTGAAKQLSLAAAVGVGVTSAMTVYLYLHSGRWPDYLQMFQFLRSHAVAGYYAVPMQERQLAFIPLFLYMVGLFYVLHCVVRSRNTYLARVVCVLSLYGFGLFPYFLNRSQPMNLFMISFPVVLLGLVLLDRLRKNLFRENQHGEWSWGGAGYLTLLGTLLIGLSFCVDYTPTIICALRTNLTLLSEVNNGYAPASVEGVLSHSVATERQNIAFLREKTTPGASVLILSDNYDALYYGTSKTKSVLDLPSTVEWSRWDEMERLVDFLRSNETVDVFVEWDNIPPRTLNARTAEQVGEVLKSDYDVIDRAPSPGTLCLVRKKAKE